jgi:drug/metabolite transporter (DMT)-like permease
MSKRGWLLFVAMGVIWGVPYLLIKEAVGGVSVPVLVFARTALATAILLPIAAWRGQLRGLRRYAVPLVAFALVEMIGPWFLLSDAEKHLSSSFSGLLIAAVPVIGLVLARLFGDRERITAVRWVGLALGFGGVVVLAGPGSGDASAWAVIEVLLTALGYALGPIIANRWLSDAPGLAVAATSLALAAVLYTPAALATWPAHVPSAKVLGSLAGLGLICTATAFVLFFALIAEVGPARATVITYVNPAVAVALGVALLGEPLSASIVGAFALILAGSVLATRRDTRRTPPATETEPLEAVA